MLIAVYLHVYFDILLVVQLWVFNLYKPGNISKALSGQWIRTPISDAGPDGCILGTRDNTGSF
jgi:hypothetical protein